jgi:hypothetical protein
MKVSAMTDPLIDRVEVSEGRMSVITIGNDKHYLHLGLGRGSPNLFRRAAIKVNSFRPSFVRRAWAPTE